LPTSDDAVNQVRFDGKAILVTGAGRGMGRDHALLLASRGAKVIVADNGTAMDGAHADNRPAESVVAEIRAAKGEAAPCFADLATENGSQEAVETCLQVFGRIDGILHNASSAPDAATADKTSTRDLDLVMRVNPYAGFWMTRAAWPHMVKQGFGRIVFIASHSIYGAEGSCAYAAAKSSYIGMLRGLAPEGVRHGILVNGVLPTARTRMTERMPSSDFSKWLLETMLPERMVAGVAYLLSAENKVYGEMFSMGGGRIARVRLAETMGFLGSDATIEEVRDAMPGIMAETDLFFPKDLVERSLKVAALMGYDGGIDAGAYAVNPIEDKKA
jgi:NAD(P)-dependent dehydrogenase (short-subunit alcohol dehydrogenase family)